jgi:putative aldouronate transport system permease protein
MNTQKMNMKTLGKKTLINAPLIIFALICVIPLFAVISVSISEEQNIMREGYKIIPKVLDFKAYSHIFARPKGLLNAYMVSISVTVLGTISALFICSMVAYAISRRDFRFYKPIAFIVMFTMLFSGGLVPSYILIAHVLKMKNTLLVLFIPYMVQAWYVLLLQSFFRNIPMALIESAYIDGANDYRIFFTIILPLSKPALATIALFFSLIYWNDWWLPMLYIEKEKLVPLQYMLARMMNNITYLANIVKGPNVSLPDMPNESVRMAMCVIAAGPMLFIFPFFQKYFVRGITTGSIKG